MNDGILQTATAKNWAVIVAAGLGSRFGDGAPKQYQILQGKLVLEYSISAFNGADIFAGIILVVAKDDDFINDLILPQSVTIVIGGKERSDSVLNGLSALIDVAGADDWVWIHDGARPCIGDNFLTALAVELGDHSVGGIPAIAVTDTIKSAASGEVIKTEPRANLWQAQTPQIFRYQILTAAMTVVAKNNNEVTDESAAIEQFGLKPMLLTGRDCNVKITRRQDLALADYYLANSGDS
ncbi:MAG: 2-C-methyl-D-erythritol 4-phosphate cytidylyltransferase [Pseudomonadales bacterium]|jgi:2-C-methyl-D-erythritol 4-phosphate cytidylyltransferase